MTPGLAVASFFAGVALLLAMRIVYELVQRRCGYMRGVQRHLANVVLLLAFIVPAIPGITYGGGARGRTIHGNKRVRVELHLDCRIPCVELRVYGRVPWRRDHARDRTRTRRLG